MKKLWRSRKKCPKFISGYGFVLFGLRPLFFLFDASSLIKKNSLIKCKVSYFPSIRKTRQISWSVIHSQVAKIVNINMNYSKIKYLKRRYSFIKEIEK